MQHYAIIVAGGRGTRMGAELPKQFIEVGGVPILMQTLEKFYRAIPSIEIVLVLPEDQFVFWQELKERHGFLVPHSVCAGGHSRFLSVKNGLGHLGDSGIVSVHDGVRPLIPLQVIQKAHEAAAALGNAITAIPLKDSIRERSGRTTVARNRDDFMLVQTPQTFDVGLLKSAYQVEESPLFTDDASVFEHAGHVINIIAGDPTNVKITTPEDLLIAKAFLPAGGHGLYP